MSEDQTPLSVDVVVVGAGMSGLYALKRLLDLGLETVVLERGDGVGGTWFWNRYPGARCDVPSMEYSFGFDPELEQEWEWTERFASQPEIERYLNHIADRYDLRPHIRLGESVTSAVFDEADAVWELTTAGGTVVRARWCVMATGGLSAPNRPDLPGLDSFAGSVVHTGLWPAEGVELEGRKVGIIGTGSSGVQAVPELARVASHLTVFQRTATFAWPSQNRTLTEAEQAEIKARYQELRRIQHEQFAAVSDSGGALILQRPLGRRILDSTPEEREAVLAEHGFNASRVWDDASSDLEANEMAVELFREMVRRTVDDAEVAEALSPRGYPQGCKRPVVGSQFFETFNRDDVTLVDVRAEPIVEVTAAGIRTAARFVELDVLVLATGFDAMTGALTRMHVQGRDGRVLRDDWTDGPRTYLGVGVEGYPNLFICVGPQSPGVLANYPPQIEMQVGWIVDFIAHLHEHGHTSVDVDAAAQDEWCDHVAAIAEGTMFTAPSCNSWYNGQNIEGKPRVFLPYVGGLPSYMARCHAVAEAGYDGFVVNDGV